MFGQPVILLLSWSAFAGIPLVYDTTLPNEVLEQAAARTGLPASQFDLVTLESLLKGPPRVLGSAVLRHCSGNPTRAAELLGHAVRGEAAWQASDVALAMDELDLGIGGLGCLSERVDPAVAARMFLLRGGLLARAGEKEEAAAELRTAVSLGAPSSWPADLPSEGKPIFEDVQVEIFRVQLWIAPAGEGGIPAVDGQNVAEVVLLRAGLHLLQMPSTAGLRSAWLTLDGESFLVLPGNFRRPILERLSDPAGQEGVEALIEAGLGHTAAYVAEAGALYLLSPEEQGLSTTVLVAPPPPPVQPEKKPKKGKKSKNP